MKSTAHDAGPDDRPDDRIIVSSAGMARGALRIFPIGLGAFMFALVYGLLAGQRGLSLTETMMMSASVFAGASQMVAVREWASPVPVGALVAAVLTVNIRHVLMGAVLTPWLGRIPRWKAMLSLFFMADEVWGVSVPEMNKGGRDAGFFLGAGVTLYLMWLTGSALGRIFGELVPDPAQYGAIFLTVAPFIALLGAVWRGWGDIPAWIVSGAMTVTLGSFLPGTWPILLGALSGSLVGAWIDVRRQH